MAANKKPFHETVAENLIEQLKAGTAPWQKPWEPGSQGFMPMNPTTGKRYKGVNAIHLMAQGRTDNRWMTYKQAKSVGAHVRKGEKGTAIQYWKFSEEKNKTDDKGKPVLDEKGKPIKETIMLERPSVFFATVFNGEQVDGIPPMEQRERNWDSIERAEKILKMSGADIRHGEHDRAFYRPSTDSIHLPGKDQFSTADNYYATALHELGHWTGHSSRLDRDMVHPFGSEGYAKEELKAECFSLIMGDELGVGHDPGQHAAYVGSWIRALQDDPLEIFRATSDAEKMTNYVLAFEQKQVQKQPQEESMDVERTQEAEMTLSNSQQNDLGVLGSPFKTGQSATFHYTRNLTSAGQAPLGMDFGQDIEPAGEYMVIDQDKLSESDGWESGTISFNNPIVLEHKSTRSDGWKRDLSEMFSGKTGKDLTSAIKQGGYDGIITIDTYSREPGWVLSEAVNIKGNKNLYAQQQSKAQVDALTQERTYLDVPYPEKDEAKELGARWDRQKQSWYVPPGKDAGLFSKWSKAEPNSVIDNESKQYLAVPYGERGAAKAAGAKWDKSVKSWYVGPKGDMDRLSRWLPENIERQQNPAMSPREEFKDAMKSLGCVISGEHPVMDGKKHRIAVEGDKKGERSGFYVGYLDGHPAGYISNNRTGIDMKWKSKGYSLDPAEKAKLQAEAAEKLAARAAELERVQEATAARVKKQMGDLLPVKSQTPYMKSKSIMPHPGVLTDNEGKKTYIPAYDENGKQWTMQYIQEDGTKRFAKDSRKEGCFHIVGGDMKALEAAPALVIQEGYATAATNTQALGFATVAAFDSGNLPNVAKVLHNKFPNKPVVILGDDDRHQELTQGTNPGKSKANDAAKLVGGKAVFPIFAPGEAGYPSNFEPVTPQKYREHLRAAKALESAPAERKAELQKALLSKDQLTALEHMKTHTDFNDLATKSRLGIDGVERQVKAVLDKAIRDFEHERNEKKLEKQVHKQKRSARMS